MSNKPPIRLRPANAEDVSFIFSSWLRSFRGSLFASSIMNEIYFSEHHKTIEKILKHYEVIVACNTEDPSQIYGFICAGYTDNILTIHYIYVKHPFRRMGIAKAMLESYEYNHEYVGVYTHQTKIAQKLANKYNLIYHPYIGLNPEVYKREDKKTKVTK